MNFGVLAALGIMCFICFVPGINDVSTRVLNHWLSMNCISNKSEEAVAFKEWQKAFALTSHLHVLSYPCLWATHVQVFGAYPRLAAPFFLLPALAAGALLLVWSELRKATLRNLIDRPTATFARIFGW